MAGVTVALVALPLAMAFSISSGLRPEAGLYTAIVAGFIISALGGSMTQIGGPTGAFVVVVAGIIQKYGVDALFVCTLMAGGALVLLGATGLGSAVKFIPRPVVIGFTNGIAVLIASTQIKDFFGLKIEKVPSEFLPRMTAIVGHWSTLSVIATLMAAGTLGLIIVLLRVSRRIPGSIISLLLFTALATMLHWPVETVGSKFGGIPTGLPKFHIPVASGSMVLALIGPAMTVTMLGAIESLLSAVVADRMSGDRHNPNVELIAQGIANICSPFVGGLPATGAIARTATNIRSGATSPISGMVASLGILVIILYAAPLAKLIPLGVLSGILMMVSYNMGEWKEIPGIVKLGKADAAVWLITFALTVFADLTVAVEAGMILAALLYIHRVTQTTIVERVTDEYVREGEQHSLQIHPIPQGIAVYRIGGPFMFGSTDKLQLDYNEFEELPKVVLLRLRNMNAIDGTGLHAIEEFADRLHKSGRELVLCGAKSQPRKFMQQAEFHRHVGEENILPNLEAAVIRLREILN